MSVLTLILVSASPATGDNFPIVPVVGVGILAVVVAIFMAAASALKKKKDDDDEK